MEEKQSLPYRQYKSLDFAAIESEVAAFWENEKVFEQSVHGRENAPAFTFYEGPPSANGVPGIHHVLSRSIKDIFCRYKTLRGYKVKRKAGWDTHGLPVELQVEKMLGITKADVGTKITLEEYNAACRKDVMKFKDRWDELTARMGYWLDLSDPYITFDNKYIESTWHLLKRLYDKGLLYTGYTIQPYSPAAGTGLSSHELNLPGCYKQVSDLSCVAQFKIIGSSQDYFLAWTTTPWTLPANTALAVGKDIIYVKIATYNPYTYQAVNVILAKDLVSRYFSPEQAEIPLESYTPGDKKIPYQVIEEYKGRELVGIQYEQLLPYVQPDGTAFKVIIGDFVSTEDGTGIVHIAPTFGADDLRVARQNGIAELTVLDADGKPSPLVDKQGKFVKEVTDFAGRYVKDYTNDPEYKSVDIDIVIKLKTENKCFKSEKYLHNYPHCWRTDKPVLYYPLDSWFIRTSALNARMVELNQQINWKPETTGTKRFGNWLENLVDWNLSRSRFWGTPLPIWVNEDRTEFKCIGSIAELRAEVAESVAAGLMQTNPLAENPDFDLHRPYVDNLILKDTQGKSMYRETDLIDVWFDSGAMPYAQWHYPFENEAVFKANFPADFIAEGIDQTRGWFFTLHAIAVMLEDSVAFKNVIANGLVLDKDGNKMSKRLGNTIDPFETIATYGADPTRWYMIENTPPWENLRFNLDGITETQNRFYGTLYNTYNFFALYANIDGWVIDEQNVCPIPERSELDRWILSELYQLVQNVEKHYESYDPTRVARAIQDFTIEQLSNWYVRLSRRRFWKSELTQDKRAAYETLFQCLMVVAQLMSPISPFFSEWLYKNLSDCVRPQAVANQTPLAPASIHLTAFTQVEPQYIDHRLIERMAFAQTICSMVRSIRRKVNLKIRQPLQRLLIPILDDNQKEQIQAVADLIKNEVNIKEIEYVTEENGVIVKRIKPNFKVLGPKVGAKMKLYAAAIESLNANNIRNLEQSGRIELQYNNETFTILREEVEIGIQDLPGWSAASDGKITVALDITLTDTLIEEGIARELVNRIQNLRKDLDFEVTDSIEVIIEAPDEWRNALHNFGEYIKTETLARKLETVPALDDGFNIEVNGLFTKIKVSR